MKQGWAFVCAVALILASCASSVGATTCETQTEKPDVSDLVAQGKLLLGQRKPDQAWDVFSRVVELRNDLPDGHLGMYLADEIVFTDMLRDLIEYYIAMFNDLFGSRGAKGHGKVAGSIIQEMIEEYYRPLLVEMTDELDEIEGEFSFYLPSYPLLVYHRRLVCDLGGEWDQSDVLIMRGAARWWLGLADLLLSYD
ncbi:MAG TPA: hypothetical protein ENF73_07130, partial [Proteobacteria bacterium]|nr:hypothetical protein [Pseudomonadota bacterium]